MSIFIHTKKERENNSHSLKKHLNFSPTRLALIIPLIGGEAGVFCFDLGGRDVHIFYIYALD